MATPIEVTGTLTGLTRKLGKNGEVLKFSIQTARIESWNRLLAHAEGEVAVTLVPQQGDLDLGPRNGKRRGKLTLKDEAGDEA